MRRLWHFLGRPAAIILVLSLWVNRSRGSDPPATSVAKQPNSSSPMTPLGFTPHARQAELDAEAHALAVPTPESARKWLRTITAEPHVAGTPADYKTAVFVRDKLREWGWKADIEELEVLLNYPDADRLPSLQIRRPISKVLDLNEAPVGTDKDSASSAAFGAFNGYGVSGDATGQLVYVNYGRPDDYSALEKLGIDVKDKIVLTRYGGLFRGLKVLNAQKRGAKGILIYSDPADDGFAKGDVYPNGRFRPGSAIQRGSVQFLSLGPGDPSTPFGPSIKGAKRLPIDSADGFTCVVGSRPEDLFLKANPNVLSVGEWEKESGLKRDEYFAMIPSLPLSYDNAEELFRVLAGPTVPSGWQGGLPLAYHVGPGPAEVSMTIRMDYQIRKIWNVIATIPGTVEPDRWVIVGNHRDAWVYGAVDPGSGTAATLEMCRALGSAVKNGWKPRRTLLYASWDAEEYGLVGSTEWAEENAKSIDEKAALLLNVDSAVSGPELQASGVPSLRDLVLDAAGSITEPRTGKTLRETWTDARLSAWADSAPLVLDDPAWKDGKTSERSHHFMPQMGYLGSGSDFTVFLDHLAVPAIDVGFHGGYGVYHSIYDDFNWMEKFGDPEFLTHATAARLYTLIAMRAAAADILPLKFIPYARALREHVDELRLMHAKRERKKEASKSVTGSEHAGLEGLVEAVLAFEVAAAELDRATASLASRDAIRAADLAALNDALTRVERAFLLEKGLPGRPWFKHAVYAPGLTTGYACWPLPAIRQAIEEKDDKRVAVDLSMTVDRIKKATAALQLARERADAALANH
jgi:N-acetylated-alpha-linked acidic dipeptidase